MRPARRWPLHPAPKDGESLSSWLSRIANCYQMELTELLEHDLGHCPIEDLDLAPPLPILMVIAERGGIEIDRLRCMSFAGWTPWLLDSLDGTVPSALETYVSQFSVLLPEGSRKARSILSWRSWLPLRPLRRACPLCLRESTGHPLLLMWQLPLLLSCPTHGCWLESYLGDPWRFWGWGNRSCEPRYANASIAAMDRRTWQALTTGYVELPRRRVHAGIWFRLLRTLLDELNTPVSQCGYDGGRIRAVWENCGFPLRAGQSLWQPFEILETAVQLQMLEAAATAIHLIESRAMSPRGELAELFWPQPQTEFSIGLPANQRQKATVSPWDKALRAIEEAIAEARRNPEEARALFRLMAYGRRDPGAIEQLRARFADEYGIPLEFLSHNQPT